MKTGEASYRQSRAPRVVHARIQDTSETNPDQRKRSDLSQRAQRRLLESEERRRKRKARRKSSREKADSPDT